MRRIQGFEFNDQAWLPGAIREAIVETLGQGLEMAGVYENVVPEFTNFCQQVQCQTILDLCSGSGEPISILVRAMEKVQAPTPKFLMSDLFPNQEAMARVCARHPDVVEMIPTPVSATDVPRDIDCQAVMINNAFHHFPPDLGLQILRDAVSKQRAIFIVEGLNGDLSRYLSLFVWLFAAGALRPFRSEKQGLDWVLQALVTLGPLLPLGAWDGLVSTMRVHRKRDMMAMAGLLGEGYAWEFKEVPYSVHGKSVIFMGKPL
ncbi:MAG: hypothetical protein JEZ02_09615 [Desulfatibacillum sp.]|nr:hypothetical protein [Desulfatibacillum sp.]